MIKNIKKTPDGRVIIPNFKVWTVLNKIDYFKNNPTAKKDSYNSYLKKAILPALITMDLIYQQEIFDEIKAKGRTNFKKLSKEEKRLILKKICPRNFKTLEKMRHYYGEKDLKKIFLMINKSIFYTNVYMQKKFAKQ